MYFLKCWHKFKAFLSLNFINPYWFWYNKQGAFKSTSLQSKFKSVLLTKCFWIKYSPRNENRKKKWFLSAKNEIVCSCRIARFSNSHTSSFVMNDLPNGEIVLRSKRFCRISGNGLFELALLELINMIDGHRKQGLLPIWCVPAHDFCDNGPHVYQNFPFLYS